MAKPIFVITIPAKNVKEISEEKYRDIIKILKQQTNDEYHIIICFSSDTEKLLFECFNVENATPIQFEEMQETIFEMIKTMKDEEDSGI